MSPNVAMPRLRSLIHQIEAGEDLRACSHEAREIRTGLLERAKETHKVDYFEAVNALQNAVGNLDLQSPASRAVATKYIDDAIAFLLNVADHGPLVN